MGGSIVRAATAAGHAVSALTRGADAAGRMGDPPDLVLLAVPDPVIAQVAADLASAGWLRAPTAVVHTSGSLGLEPLETLLAAGHEVGGWHPLQTFPQVRGPEAFRGITVGVLASAPGLLATLEALARSVGATPRVVPDGDRDLYHAAAATAANHLVALAGQAVGLLEAAGWTRQEALSALLPLMQGAVTALDEGGLPGALTGPISRGDAATVARHRAAIAGRALRESILPGEVYRILGLAALRIAVEAGLDPEPARRITEALTGVAGSDPEVMVR